MPWAFLPPGQYIELRHACLRAALAAHTGSGAFGDETHRCQNTIGVILADGDFVDTDCLRIQHADAAQPLAHVLMDRERGEPCGRRYYAPRCHKRRSSFSTSLQTRRTRLRVSEHLLRYRIRTTAGKPKYIGKSSKVGPAQNNARFFMATNHENSYSMRLSGDMLLRYTDLICGRAA